MKETESEAELDETESVEESVDQADESVDQADESVDDMDEELVAEQPSAGPQVKLIGALVLALIIGVGLGGALFGGASATAPVEDGSHEGHEHAEDGTIWTCSMHPQIQQSESGQCPICGMDLIPMQSRSELGPDQVQLSDRARRLAQIRTSPVVRSGDPSIDLRLLGRIDYAESKQKIVTAWTGGRIERLHMNTTGEKVRRGQAIATVYSPEIYAAHQDLLTAKKQVAKLDPGFARTSAEATLGSTRQKLRLLGVPDSEVASMEKADSPWRNVRIRSPFSGTVIKRLVSEGVYVKPGTGLYELANLGQLWVQLDAYESDIARLAIGQKVDIEVSAFPGQPFGGVVAFIDPVVNTKTRTTRVRVEVDNSDGRLRPGMFAEATVRGEQTGTAPLVIPESAPLFSGRRSVVYVALNDADEPIYEAREVRLGPKMGTVFPVVAGLEEGEHVVTSGAFALDADLQIRGGLSLMTRGDDTNQTAFDEMLVVPPAFTEAMRPMVEHYLSIQEALAVDDLDAALAAVALMRTAVGGFIPLEPVEAATVWTVLRGELSSSLMMMENASTLEGVRGPFERLSSSVMTLLHRFGNPLDNALRLAFCPMAFDAKGAQWVQRGEAIGNSYFGQRMTSCGEVRSIIASGTHYVPQRDAPEPEEQPESMGGMKH